MTEEKIASALASAVVVHARPGDVILFRSPTRLSPTARAEWVGLLNTLFPDHESLILESGQDIAVLRPQPGFFRRLLRRL